MAKITTTKNVSSGRLIYLIGSSGAGKDTLLNAIQQDGSVKNTLVAHRYVARKNSAGKFYENQLSLTFDEFDYRQSNDFFAMHWRAHEAAYGIGVEIELWLKAGTNVLVNGSRQYLPHVLEKYPEALIVGLVVSEDVLIERMIHRGRETEQEIQERIHRNQQLVQSIPEQCISIDNSGSLENTMTQFQTLLGLS